MLNPNYFETFQVGMTAQVKELPTEEMVDYVLNHLHSFLLDDGICFCFIERLANDPETGKSERASKILLYLLDKGLQLRPFRPGLLEAVFNLTRNPSIEQRFRIIDEFNESKEIYGQISALNLRHDGEDAREYIGKLIEAHPTHVAAAQFALSVDKHFGDLPGPWLDIFQCPPALRRDWEIHLFNHYASLCAYDEAMALWPRLKVDMLRETSLNLAAEMFIAAGNAALGRELYAASLKQDPRQTPVALRIKELDNPFTADATLLDTCKVNICLYSWNKADMLGMTLDSLAESDIGSARIDVLLNGCTDHSREVVEAAREKFPDNEFHIHDLHVNIGAPAARNWLMFLPEIQASDYIAFLDDDITMQPDWLASFLTIAEADEQVAVVGCKTVHPGQPAMYQYLYRYIAIADHGLLRMAIHSPNRQFDNHVYDVVRETRNVMGCLHLLRTSAQKDIPAGFDIRFSPSQVDDIDHDIGLALAGHKIMYCGQVTCVHHQSSGTNANKVEYKPSSIGSIMGNDIKFYFKHSEHLDKLKALDNLSLDLGVEPPGV